MEGSVTLLWVLCRAWQHGGSIMRVDLTACWPIPVRACVLRTARIGITFRLWIRSVERFIGVVWRPHASHAAI